MKRGTMYRLLAGVSMCGFVSFAYGFGMGLETEPEKLVAAFGGVIAFTAAVISLVIHNELEW
ncbi:hypothetical protein UE99_018960 [Burkholderia cenocepacia]|nr:hypothetical protein [Burkholderia cenocepacia]OQD23148.1 hypothetical protein UE98_16365 [Burkholderia cenocepacia]GLZ73775.1 hypothetical protein Bcon01_68200 [Burkholderia contaminans]